MVRTKSPIGEVLGIASEHDEVAGTARGANTLFVFTLAGTRIAHLGDLGQRSLRAEQLAALGTVDRLFVPVGGGPTIGAEQAMDIAVATRARALRRRPTGDRSIKRIFQLGSRYPQQVARVRVGVGIWLLVRGRAHRRRGSRRSS